MIETPDASTTEDKASLESATRSVTDALKIVEAGIVKQQKNAGKIS